MTFLIMVYCALKPRAQISPPLQDALTRYLAPPFMLASIHAMQTLLVEVHIPNVTLVGSPDKLLSPFSPLVYCRWSRGFGKLHSSEFGQ